MALAAKERGVFKNLNEKVDIDEQMEPVSVDFMGHGWKAPRKLEVLGMSKETDLIDSNIDSAELSTILSLNQYILADDEMNIYQAFIIIYDEPVKAVLKSIRTVPHK